MASTQDDYPNIDQPEAGLLSPDNPITEDIQEFALSPRVEFWDVDLRPIDSTAGIVRFTPNIGTGASITWRGNEYIPIDIYSSGWEMSMRGSLPRPTVGIRSINNTIKAALLQYNNFERAIVTKWITHQDFIDGEAYADPEAYYPPQIYRVERMSGRDNTYVEWELSALTDFEGRKIPRRQLLRDFCTYTYRIWNGSSFEARECPYSVEGTVVRLLEFISGGTYQIKVGDVIVGDESSASSTILVVSKTSGTWAGGDAVGTLVVQDQTGNYQEEHLNVGANLNVATVLENSESYSVYFDRSGNPTTAGNDSCGRLLSDCRKRFPGLQDIPAFMFKGLARARID